MAIPVSGLCFIILLNCVASILGYLYIESQPSDQSAIEGHDAVFLCDPNTHPSLKNKQVNIRWMYENVPLTARSSKKYQINKNNKSLTIKKVALSDAGNYLCKVQLGAESDMRSAKLTVKGRPSPPVEVQIVNCLTNAAEILWQPGADNGSPIINYIVQFNTSLDRSKWYDYYEDIPSNTRITAVNLPPWGNYTFRLRARNEVGLSEPSSVTRYGCGTSADRPDTNPKDVGTLTHKTGKLVIKWTPMSPLSQHGPGFHYLVSWRRKGSTYWKTESIHDLEQSQFAFDINMIYELYEVKVKASNSLGDSYQPAFVFLGRSGEAEPTAIPKDFRLDPIRPVESNSVHFIWEAVDTSVESIKGGFRGYKIYYWEAKLGRHLMKAADILVSSMKTRAGQDIRAELRNLPANMLMRAQVAVINQHFVGPLSPSLEFFTPEGKPDGVQNLHIEKTGDDYVILRWLVPTKSNGILKGYDIGFQKNDERTIQSLRPQIRDPAILGVRITGLKQDVKYIFYVWARTGVGRGQASHVDVITGKGPTKSRSPSQISNPPYSYTGHDTRSSAGQKSHVQFLSWTVSVILLLLHHFLF